MLNLLIWLVDVSKFFRMNKKLLINLFKNLLETSSFIETDVK